MSFGYTDNDLTLYMSCDYEILTRGISLSEWRYMLQALCRIINAATSCRGKQDLVGFIIHTLRRQFLTGHKNLYRYHFDALIDAFISNCSLKSSEIENALIDYE